ncbi:NAD-dependent epimerase/dehydratase family protein [Amycolatopsis sp. QT-25]|uniref:NAD-dependent epimerase/dehydratase family protein n=1 Tax=Amycolatopsis sp. QT-25 TaxID=3034022 RepID=UPI0023EC3602|nr:NAD-dependent epimerase/dehydratase family protein [Amycolatopsis sp. QT-25]WET82366.1 NAD-dependent epimerase/dehydratase family protein [Amycolatopsis sp. QT-25]
MTSSGKRIVVTGATGNVGTAVVRALGSDPEVGSIVGVARRPSRWESPKTEFVTADVARDDLRAVFDGADVVIHLAWLFQPTHRPEITWRSNVLGSIRVFEAVQAMRVPALVYASSIGAYSPRDDDHPVAEDWPTHGSPNAAYTREKAYVERVLEAFDRSHPRLRVVRLRPGFLFQKAAAPEQRRLFGGPLVPGKLVRPSLIPVLPDIPQLRIQTAHTDDVADAYRRCALQDVKGAFNIAADPVLDTRALARIFGAKPVKVPAVFVRRALAAAWSLHLIPATPGLFDAVLHLPVMDCTRAREELGWTPRYSSEDAIAAFLEGLREGEGFPTEPLKADVGRGHELATGVGERP